MCVHTYYAGTALLPQKSEVVIYWYQLVGIVQLGRVDFHQQHKVLVLLVDGVGLCVQVVEGQWGACMAGDSAGVMHRGTGWAGRGVLVRLADFCTACTVWKFLTSRVTAGGQCSLCIVLSCLLWLATKTVTGYIG